jgi:hypothetical protein
MITAEFPVIKQTVPPSYSHHLRLCPVHILQENSTAVGGNSSAPPSGSNSGRIMISGEYAVINQTVAANEDDVLTLPAAHPTQMPYICDFTATIAPPACLPADEPPY